MGASVAGQQPCPQRGARRPAGGRPVRCCQAVLRELLRAAASSMSRVDSKRGNPRGPRELPSSRYREKAGIRGIESGWSLKSIATGAPVCSTRSAITVRARAERGLLESWRYSRSLFRRNWSFGYTARPGPCRLLRADLVAREAGDFDDGHAVRAVKDPDSGHADLKQPSAQRAALGVGWGLKRHDLKI